MTAMHRVACMGGGCCGCYTCNLSPRTSGVHVTRVASCRPHRRFGHGAVADVVGGTRSVARRRRPVPDEPGLCGTMSATPALPAALSTV